MRWLGEYIRVYVVCVTVFLSLLVVVSLVPRFAIESQAERSAHTLMEEGDYPNAWPSMHEGPDAVDSFTTSLSLNIAIHAVGHPVLGPLRGAYYRSSGSSAMCQNLMEGLNLPAQVDYARYWHGYLALLVPLLLLLDISQIRVLFLLVEALLCVSIVAKLGMRFRIGVTIAFGLAFLYCNPWGLAASTSQFPCFLVALCATLYIVYRADSNVELGEDIGGPFFFLLGALTVYLDFLDTPIVALGFPLAVYALVHARDFERCSIHVLSKKMLLFVLSWAAGYILLWVTKWLVALVALGPDSLAGLTSIMGQWSSIGGQGPLEAVSRMDAIRQNVSTMFPGWTVFIGKVLAVLWLVITVIFFKKSSWKLCVAFLGTALLPIAWYCALPTHSYIHAFFTYRSLSVSVFALLLICCCLTDWDAIYERLEGLVKR